MKSRFVQHGVISQPHQIIMEMLEARNEGPFIQGSNNVFKWRIMLAVAMLSLVGLLYKFAIPSVWEILAILAVSYIVTMGVIYSVNYLNEKVSEKGIKAIFCVLGIKLLIVMILSLFL